MFSLNSVFLYIVSGIFIILNEIVWEKRRNFSLWKIHVVRQGGPPRIHVACDQNELAPRIAPIQLRIEGRKGDVAEGLVGL